MSSIEAEEWRGQYKSYSINDSTHFDEEQNYDSESDPEENRVTPRTLDCDLFVGFLNVGMDENEMSGYLGLLEGVCDARE